MRKLTKTFLVLTYFFSFGLFLYFLPQYTPLTLVAYIVTSIFSGAYSYCFIDGNGSIAGKVKFFMIILILFMYGAVFLEDLALIYFGILATLTVILFFYRRTLYREITSHATVKKHDADLPHKNKRTFVCDLQKTSCFQNIPLEKNPQHQIRRS